MNITIIILTILTLTIVPIIIDILLAILYFKLFDKECFKTCYNTKETVINDAVYYELIIHTSYWWFPVISIFIFIILIMSFIIEFVNKIGEIKI